MGALMFDPAALDAVVSRVLLNTPDIPEGHHGAFVTVANQDGIRAAIAIKVGDEWHVEASVSHGWHDGSAVAYGAKVTGTF